MDRAESFADGEYQAFAGRNLGKRCSDLTFI